MCLCVRRLVWAGNGTEVGSRKQRTCLQEGSNRIKLSDCLDHVWTLVKRIKRNHADAILVLFAHFVPFAPTTGGDRTGGDAGRDATDLGAERRPAGRDANSESEMMNDDRCLPSSLSVDSTPYCTVHENATGRSWVDAAWREPMS